MQWFLGTYTTRFNRRHKLFGHLFSGGYKSLLVDGSASGYLKAVCDYVRLKHVRAKLLKPEQRLSEYRWSSWPEYLKTPAKRWEWLRVDRLIGEWGVRQDNAAGRRQLEQAMEQRKELEWSRESGDWKRLRRGWCWGPKEFRDEMLELIGQKQGDHHYGEELKESDQQKAQTVGWRDAAQGRMVGGRIEAPSQKRSEESAHGGETAVRDGNDLAMDRRAGGDGPLANSGPCGAKDDFAKD